VSNNNSNTWDTVYSALTMDKSLYDFTPELIFIFSPRQASSLQNCVWTNQSPRLANLHRWRLAEFAIYECSQQQIINHTVHVRPPIIGKWTAISSQCGK